MDKHTLRKKVKTRRDILSPEMVIRLSSKITTRFLKELLPSLGPVKSVMAYMPIQSEVKTARAINSLLSMGVNVHVPCIRGNEITPAVYTKKCRLVSGPFRIKEPAKKKTVGSPKNLDVVIVPGIVFDMVGHRIGFGKGYYDRFLKRLSKDAVKVGFSFEKQLVPAIPHESHDVHMNYIVTEKRIIKTHGVPQ
jgi:5-formyltetrahydrofolate cyclo-ligase